MYSMIHTCCGEKFTNEKEFMKKFLKTPGTFFEDFFLFPLFFIARANRGEVAVSLWCYVFRVIESSQRMWRANIFVGPMKEHEDRKYTCRHSSSNCWIALQLAREPIAWL